MPPRGHVDLAGFEPCGIDRLRRHPGRRYRPTEFQAAPCWPVKYNIFEGNAQNSHFRIFRIAQGACPKPWASVVFRGLSGRERQFLR